MSGVLIVAEAGQGRIDDVTRELVTAAAGLGGPVRLGVAGSDPRALLEQGGIAGVDEVVKVTTASARFDHELQQDAVRAMIDAVAPDVVLAAFTIRSASYAAALAEAMNLNFASDVIAVNRDESGELVAVRPMYAGKVHAELGFEGGRPVLLLLRPNTFAAAEAGEVAPVRDISVDSASSRVRHVAYSAPEGDDVDLKRAEVIFAVGRGVGSVENIEVFVELADKLGAELGASRPLVDAGWLPTGRQVGQTGQTVKPRVYVAFGISGSQQHLAGMSGSKTIIAVNTDTNAPIFKVADVGAVADINEVADEMKALI